MRIVPTHQPNNKSSLAVQHCPLKPSLSVSATKGNSLSRPSEAFESITQTAQRCVCVCVCRKELKEKKSLKIYIKSVFFSFFYPLINPLCHHQTGAERQSEILQKENRSAGERILLCSVGPLCWSMDLCFKNVESSPGPAVLMCSPGTILSSSPNIHWEGRGGWIRVVPCITMSMVMPCSASTVKD